MGHIIEHIIAAAGRQKDKTAFFYFENGEEKALSYGSFLDLVYSFSQVIRSKKVTAGSIVLLAGENSPKWPAAYLAAHMSGLTVVQADARYTALEFQTITRFTEPSLILCDRKLSGFFGPEKERIFLEDVQPGDPCGKPEMIPLAKDQPMSIIFTSGTTADPKGVMLSENNILSNLEIVGKFRGFVTQKDRIAAVLPFHHVYPFTCTVILPLYVGATLIYPRSLKGEDVFGAIKRHRGTLLVAVPKILELFCDKVIQGAESLAPGKRYMFHKMLGASKRLRALGINAGKLFFKALHRNFPGFRFFACGGARLDAEVHRKLYHLGFDIIEAYGLTETSPIAAINIPGSPVPGSAGKAAPGVGLKAEKKGPSDEFGEICIKGPNVMMGYYRRPDLTGEAVTDGWFHSGDLGYIDAKGSLFLTGRKKEMIVLSNGKNIYPEELEKLYRQNEMIKELCVTLFREGEKEFLTAVVFPNKEFFIRNKRANVYQGIKFEIETVAQRLPSYQRVTRIEIVDEELPKTSLGKTKRYKVAELIRGKRPKNEAADVAAEQADPFLAAVKDVLRLEDVPSFMDNLETDLGLDSLSKLEFFSAMEKRYGITITEDQAAAALTLRDVRKVVPEGQRASGRADENNLEKAITVSPEPPLEKHVSAGSNIFETAVRFICYIGAKIYVKVILRARLEGKEHLKVLTPPFIIAPNHNSLVDGIVIYGLFPFRVVNTCFFISLPEYFDKFPLSMIRKIGRVIMTGTHDTAVKSLQYCYQVLKSGKNMCVFPEGKRSLDGNVDRPKKGIGHAAGLTGAAILPVYLEGMQALYSRRNPGFNRSEIRARIFPPIKTDTGVDVFLEQWHRELQGYHESLQK